MRVFENFDATSPDKAPPGVRGILHAWYRGKRAEVSMLEASMMAIVSARRRPGPAMA